MLLFHQELILEECHGHLISQPLKSSDLEHSDFQPLSLDTSRVEVSSLTDIGSLVRFLGSCYSKAWLAPGGFLSCPLCDATSPLGRSKADSVLGRKRASCTPLRPVLPAAHPTKHPAISHLHPLPSHWTDGNLGHPHGCLGTGAQKSTQVTRNRLKSQLHQPLLKWELLLEGRLS